MKMSKKLMAYAMSFGVLFLTIFSGLPISHAETYGYLTGDEVRLRKNPTTNEDNVLRYLDKGDYVILENTNKVSGTGCDEGWYKVSSGSLTGYVCSKYISLTDTYEATYQRPWTSPKKAIMGGAEFIADGYISAGQFTSYLKKFNVNPNGHYAVNNHQYMANIEAPYSEAKSTYNSYRDNNLLNLPFEFTIPIFENMPETTKHTTKGVKTGGTSTIKDTAFENKLNEQGFPESYKKWLRVLHEKYSNWNFISLKTGLDFNSTVSTQQRIGSIERSSCAACIDSSRVNTEGDWYIANFETVGYYLDPRNFLDEIEIFMFENLSYNEIQTESVVKSVLASTFMSGNDPIDNVPYSSIFMEAGKKFNVSPVYLASLSRQEVGVKGGTVTNGGRFTYEGQTYEGFYNFFNIGAYSSASNPALAGLVYASAGSRKNGEGIYVGNMTNSSASETQNQNQSTNNVTSVSTHLSKMGLNKKGSFITNLSLNTTAGNLKSKTNGSELTFYKANGSLLGDTEIVTTGTKIKFNQTGEEYTIVIYGDLSGDGKINSADLLKMRQYLLGQVSLNDAYLEAARLVNVSSKINSADLLRLRQYLLNQKNINQA